MTGYMAFYLTGHLVNQSAIYNKATLNRQYIALMSALGISDETFIDMFNAEVRQIQGLPQRFAENIYDPKLDLKLVQMMCHVSLLFSNCVCLLTRSMSQFPVKPLVEAGFGRDACIQGLLRVLEVRSLFDLKWRARLSVTMGVFLMGKLKVEKLGTTSLDCAERGSLKQAFQMNTAF